MKLEKVVYTAHATATGGRDGRARSSDGRIDVVLKPPKEMGGNGEGVNPEQLFACGYAACFIGAVKFAGAQAKVAVPADTSIESAVILPKSRSAGSSKASSRRKAATSAAWRSR